MAGSEIRDLVIRIKADTSESEQAIKRLKDQLAGLGNTTVGGSGGGGGGVPNIAPNVADLTKAVAAGSLLAGAISSIAKEIVEILPQMLRFGGEVTNISTSFERLQGGSAIAQSSLQDLRVATQGLVSDFELMKSANQGVLLGLDPTKIDDLAKTATRLGQAVGRDATSALNDLILGLSRGSPRILDNIGIVVKAEEAYKKFAAANGLLAKELSEGEKKLAIQAEATEQAKKKVEELGPPIDNAATAFVQLNKNIENVGATMSVFVANSDILKGLIGGLNGLLTDAGYAFRFFLSNELEAQAARLIAKLDSLKSSAEAARKGFFPGVTETSNFDPNVARFGRGVQRNGPVTDATEAELAKVQEQIREQQLLQKFQAANAADFAKGQILAEGERERAQKKAEEAAKEAEAAAKRHRAEQERLTETINKQVFAFEKLGDKDNIESLGKALEKSIESLDQASFANLSQQYEQALTDASRKSLNEQFKEAIASGKISVDQVEAYATKVGKKGINERIAEYEKRQKEAFQQTAEFFADLLTSSVTGSFQNIAETAKDLLRRVAIGFAAQMAANVAEKLGLTGLGNIGSAQGLGQSIAATLGFEGGGVKKLGELLGEGGAATALTGSAAALDLSAAALTSAATALGAASVAGAPAAFANVAAGGDVLGPGLGSVTGSIAGPDALSSALVNSGIIAAVVAATVTTVASGISSFNAGKKGGIAAGIKSGFDSVDDLGAAFASGGLSIPINLISGIAGSFFGGDSQKSIERENREKLLDKIIEQIGGDTFQGFSGPIKLDDKKFNVSDSSGLTGQITGLVNPFAQLLTGGDDKLGSDLAGIFTDALSGADDFNEALLDAQTLMDKLGFSAEDAKKQVTELFLDGGISLQEFTADIGALNLLALDSLPNVGAVGQALELLTENLDDDSRRQALKALELAFKEMSEIGIDSTTEIHDYVLQNFGPDIAKVFDKLSELGVDSFDDIGSLGADGLAVLFSALSELKGALGTLTDSSDTAGSTTERAFSNAGSAARKAAEDVRTYSNELDKATKKAKELNSLGGGRGGSSGQNPNPPLNENPE